MIEVQIKHEFSSDGILYRVYHANKGEGIAKHQHSYSHITMCHSGSIIVRKQGRELVMTKDSQPVNLTANEWHEIESLENNTVFMNVYSQGKM